MVSGQRKLRLLIPSVGSLVGQNILDSLEFPAFPRRGRVHVAGTNSIAESANNFRCDECHLVPPTASPDFPVRMANLVRAIRPDVILPARDADTAAMWRLLDADPSLPGRLPYGSLESVMCALDKQRSSKFCQKHGLPFAESLYADASIAIEDLSRFAERVGFPLVAKPVEGFASKGVFFVRDLNEARFFADRGGFLLQEYLGPPEEMDGYFMMLDGPRPLFAEAPGVRHHTCHIPIHQDGRIGEVCILRNHHGRRGVLTKTPHLRREVASFQPSKPEA